MVGVEIELSVRMEALVVKADGFDSCREFNSGGRDDADVKVRNIVSVLGMLLHVDNVQNFHGFRVVVGEVVVPDSDLPSDHFLTFTK